MSRLLYRSVHIIRSDLIGALWHGQTVVTLSVILCFSFVFPKEDIPIVVTCFYSSFRGQFDFFIRIYQWISVDFTKLIISLSTPKNQEISSFLFFFFFIYHRKAPRCCCNQHANERSMYCQKPKTLFMYALSFLFISSLFIVSNIQIKI